MKKHLEWATKLAARFAGKERPKKPVRRAKDIASAFGLNVSAGSISFGGLYGRIRAICNDEKLVIGLHSPSWKEFEEAYLLVEFTGDKIATKVSEGAIHFITAGDREIQARLTIPINLISWVTAIEASDILASEPLLAKIFAEKEEA